MPTYNMIIRCICFCLNLPLILFSCFSITFNDLLSCLNRVFLQMLELKINKLKVTAI